MRFFAALRMTGLGTRGIQRGDFAKAHSVILSAAKNPPRHFKSMTGDTVEREKTLLCTILPLVLRCEVGLFINLELMFDQFKLFRLCLRFFLSLKRVRDGAGELLSTETTEAAAFIVKTSTKNS